MEEDVTITGHSFWRMPRRAGKERELATKTAIELDAEGLRWMVSPPGGGAGMPVESTAPQVVRFFGRVLGEMERATRRAMVRPVPKPQTEIAARSWVPCPVCQGEAWTGCECGGAGYVERHRG